MVVPGLVVGGIVAVVAFNVVRGLTAEPGGLTAEPGDLTSVTPAIVMVGMWMTGFLALSWWRMLADQRPSQPVFRSAGDGPPSGLPALLEALSIEPIDARQAARTGKASWNFTRTGMAVLSLFVLAIPVAMVLYATGTLGFEAALLPLVAVVIVLALRVPFQVERAMAIGDAWLAPLHLRITGMPTMGLDPADGEGMRVMGATSIGGMRRGRMVSVEMAADGSVVAVTGAVEPFRAVSDGERLQGIDRAPAWAAAAVAAAGRDERWRRVEVSGGPNGIVVRRRGNTGDGTAWLAYLWLAERLAAAAPKAYAA